MSVITISRQFGSGGDEIAAAVCEAMGYKFFDKRIVAEAALGAGLSDREIVDFSESRYQVKNFLGRLFGGGRGLAQVRVWSGSGSGEPVEEEVQLSEESALSLERIAIEYAHTLGNILIVGRGGQVVLRDCPGVLHVRVEAPLEDRLLRVRSTSAIASRPFIDSVETRRAAQDLIDASDAASAGYIRRFYGEDWSDPMLYHLLINTGKLRLDQAAQVIIEAARELDRVVA